MKSLERFGDWANGALPGLLSIPLIFLLLFAGGLWWVAVMALVPPTYHEAFGIHEEDNEDER